jgi:hypothetical protein
MRRQRLPKTRSGTVEKQNQRPVQESPETRSIQLGTEFEELMDVFLRQDISRCAGDNDNRVVGVVQTPPRRGARYPEGVQAKGWGR